MSKEKVNILDKYQDSQLTGTHNNWVMVELGDICDFKRGPFGSAIKKSMFVPEGINTYKVYEQGNAIRKNVEYGEYYISIEHYESLKGFSVLENDIIISCAGTIGETFVIPENYKLGVINQALMRVRLSKAILTDYFLLAFDFYIKEQAQKAAQGTAIKNLPPISEMKVMKIGLPSLEEQKRIVDKLRVYLNKIDSAQQLIEEAKATFELRRAAIVKELIDSTIESIPYEERVQKRLCDVFEIFGGGTPSKSKPSYWNGDVNWFSAKDVKVTCLTDSMDKITMEGVNNSSTKLAQNGSIVIVTRSGILKHSLPVAKLMVDATVNQDLKVFYSENQLLNDYLLWFLQANEKHILHEFSKSGTTVNSIEFERFKNIEITILPNEELKELISTIEKYIEYEKAAYRFLELEKYIDTLKRSILSKAFKGELDTKDTNDESVIELLKSII